MNEIDEVVLSRAKERWTAEAEEARYNAGMEGRYDDGGYSRMIFLLKAYESGLRGEVPWFLRSTYEEVYKETDAEYARYLELKEKFES